MYVSFCFRNFKNSTLYLLQNYNVKHQLIEVGTIPEAGLKEQEPFSNFILKPTAHLIRQLKMSVWSDVFGGSFSAQSAGAASSVHVRTHINWDKFSLYNKIPCDFEHFIICDVETSTRKALGIAAPEFQRVDTYDIRIAFSQKSWSAALLGGSLKNLKGFCR